MNLPVLPPVSPMLAKLVRELPVAEGMAYEPKWDGFRAIVFRDGDEVELGSRNERPLTRYFPELTDLLRRALPERCVVDGEIVIAGDQGLDFDALLQRIHPAASRIALLAGQTPASLVAFDLLAMGDDDLRSRPFSHRRALLQEALAELRPSVHLTPLTTDIETAGDWFARFEGAGLDGVVAKPADLVYAEGKRVMLKVKHQRTADCVVAGFRWHKDGEGVGSLLLGLYDESATLHHVGVATSFSVVQRLALVEEVAPLRPDALEGHPWRGWAEAGAAEAGAAGAAGGQRMPGGASRWNAGRSTAWEPLRPERVAEVSYDNLQGDRFRHATHLVRWRDDRDATSCTYAQLERPVPEELAHALGGA
ncbi:MAG: ATP-dependent DNA ligase [Acidimicrobiales bacterium]